MDPFTAVTGAAGLVSLGITICDGLLTYCRNYRARSNDLLVLGQHAERLRTLLRQLEERQQSTVTNSALKSLINECLGACNLCLQEFSTFSDEHSQQPPFSSLKNHGKSVARKLQYPFQRNMLEFFKQQMHEFQFALSSQMLLMNYDLTADLRDTVSESNKLGLAISAQGRDLSDQVSSVVPVVTQNVDLRIAQMEESLQRRLEVLEKLINDSLEDRQRIGSRQYTKFGSPSLNQHCIETAYTLQHPQAQQGHVSKTSVQPYSLDNPTTLEKKTKPPSQDALLNWECRCVTSFPSTHADTCIHSFRKQTKRTLVGKIKVFNYIFKYKILIQYSQHTFPRDLEVYPNFTVRSTCDWSPAFEIMRETTTRAREGLTAKDLGKEYQTCLFRLRQSFMDRQAWPTDITNFGHSLLHIACMANTLPSTDEKAALTLQFLKLLIDMGVPVNEGNQTLLYFFLEAGSCRDLYNTKRNLAYSETICRGLIKYGAELRVKSTRPLSGLGGVLTLPLRRRSLLGVPYPLEYGRLSHAVLQESEPDVRRILCTSSLAILETGPSGETPLHLAASWSRGVQILLELGGQTSQGLVDAEDSCGDTPIIYALRLEQVESIRLLISANSRINLDDTRTLEEVKLNGFRKPQSDEVIYLLGQELANRRKELIAFSCKWLSGDEALRFGLFGHQVLQEEAFSVVQALQERPIPIPWQFQGIQPGSIYHSACMSAVLAESLFRAGFNHTNVLFHGFSPLMTISIWATAGRRGMGGILDLVAWFVDHGADLNSSIPRVACSGGALSERGSRCYQTIHRIAFETAFCGKMMPWNDLSNDDPRIAQLSRILEDETTDPCNCYCARPGCSPASLFARGIWEAYHLRQISWSRQHRRNDVELINTALSSSNVQTEAITDIIRLSTFTRLGMNHTCCTYFWPLDHIRKNPTQAILQGKYRIIDMLDPEEIAEIQEEDQHLAARLDGLVEEFDVKFMELGQPFSEFFLGYWWSRMDEVDAEKDELSREDMEAIREAGVVLETRE
ncbi:hypothetical protein EDB80DRAFT_770562 [Ilyonectria destructans]|nr:hypothetical protein EDB80DRAFT_770562 [Ilyonectria destructans]